jgi:hypothetical protein
MPVVGMKAGEVCIIPGGCEPMPVLSIIEGGLETLPVISITGGHENRCLSKYNSW